LEENVTELSPDGMTPSEQLQEIRRSVEPILEQQTTSLREDILPQLEAAGIHVVNYDSLMPEEKEDLNAYFMEKVFPILTPLAVDQSHPFPYISPLSLNLGLMVEAAPGQSPGDPIHKHEPRFVRIKVPSLVPRFVPVGKLESKFVLLEELIEANRDSLFPGMITGECHRFRVTRDADIDIREDEAQELRQRRFGTPVRLEVSASMPEEMIAYLTQSLGLDVEDVYLTDGPLNLQDFMFLYDLKRPDLKDAPFCAIAPEWNRKRSIFDVLKERDMLLHHPFDSYDSDTRFLNDSVDDPEVVAIKICLYRTGPESPIPLALIRAAEKGKQVTALIELKARFD